jgi:hypothetical protein
MLIVDGCYTSTVDSLSTFKFQLPLIFYSNYKNKAIPDTSVDFVNLVKYDEYNKNKDKIGKADILSFNYWIDSLVMDNNTPFDPMVHNVEFEYVSFALHFAKLKEFPPYPADINNVVNWEDDPLSPDYILGEFTNVSVREYYRIPDHILDVNDEIAQVLSSAVKYKPQFFIKSIYSKSKGQTTPKRNFPLVNARFDMIIRFEVNL